MGAGASTEAEVLLPLQPIAARNSSPSRGNFELVHGGLNQGAPAAAAAQPTASASASAKRSASRGGMNGTRPPPRHIKPPNYAEDFHAQV